MQQKNPLFYCNAHMKINFLRRSLTFFWNDLLPFYCACLIMMILLLMLMMTALILYSYAEIPTIKTHTHSKKKINEKQGVKTNLFLRSHKHMHKHLQSPWTHSHSHSHITDNLNGNELMNLPTFKNSFHSLSPALLLSCSPTCTVFSFRFICAMFEINQHTVSHTHGKTLFNKTSIPTGFYRNKNSHTHTDTHTHYTTHSTCGFSYTSMHTTRQSIYTHTH